MTTNGLPLNLSDILAPWRPEDNSANPAIVLYSNMLFPQSYGAVADDPTKAAVNGIALQAWLDATADLGRAGYMPAGVYWIDDTELVVPNNGGDIIGDGRNVTSIKSTTDVPIDNGKALMVWSRMNATLDGIQLDCNGRASYGFVLQNGMQSRIRLHVANAAQHGVLLDGLYDGADPGFNENVVFDQLVVDNCGQYAVIQIKLQGTGLGGTFTLTVDGNTTAAIAWNATAATIAAAVKAANVAWNNPNGTNPFWETSPTDTPQTLPDGVVLRVMGILTGETPVVSIDTTNVTGDIDVATCTTPITGRRGDGVHMGPPGDTGTEFGTLLFFEPQLRGNRGNGMWLGHQGIKVQGGHIEGNFDAGIHLGFDAPVTTTVDIHMYSPWLEGNRSGGVTCNTTNGQVNRCLLFALAGAQGAEQTDRGVTMITEDSGALLTRYQSFGGNNFGALHMTPLGLFSVDGISVRRGCQVDTMNEYTTSLIVHSVEGGLTVDCRTSNNKNLRLQANITLFELAVPQTNARLSLLFEHDGGAFTIGTWINSPFWPSGTPPTLGTGGAGSRDLIELEFRNGAWNMVNAELGMTTS